MIRVGRTLQLSHMYISSPRPSPKERVPYLLNCLTEDGSLPFGKSRGWDE
jgi:hypothetical protein